jgi:hypothetical protein
LNDDLERKFLMTDVAPPPTNLQTFTDRLKVLAEAFGLFFDPARIKPRRLTCGPQAAYLNPKVSDV